MYTWSLTCVSIPPGGYSSTTSNSGVKICLPDSTIDTTTQKAGDTTSIKTTAASTTATTKRTQDPGGDNEGDRGINKVDLSVMRSSNSITDIKEGTPIGQHVESLTSV